MSKNLIPLKKLMNEDFFDDLDRFFWKPSKLIDNFLKRIDDDGGSFSNWNLDLDIEEKDKNYLIKADLPGLKKGEIDLDISDGVLTISGERKEEKQTGDEKSKFYRKERFYGSFSKSIKLPDNIDEQNIKASYSDGVLTIDIPKSINQSASKKKIEIS